jgi:hypothetical protein
MPVDWVRVFYGVLVLVEVFGFRPPVRPQLQQRI